MKNDYSDSNNQYNELTAFYGSNKEGIHFKNEINDKREVEFTEIEERLENNEKGT